jgi:hypothetical protein
VNTSFAAVSPSTEATARRLSEKRILVFEMGVQYNYMTYESSFKILEETTDEAAGDLNEKHRRYQLLI